MDRKLEEEILRLAVAKGLLNSDQMPTEARLSTLLEGDLLSVSDVDLLTKLAIEQSETLVNPQQPAFPQHLLKPDTEEMVIPAFGRFIQLRPIGQGGMARVYSAFDPSLGRTVALKLVRIDDSTLVQRLLLEARAQATVEHENVCKVYEVDHVEGRPYICMQHIDGRTVADLAREMTIEEKVQVIRQVSEALHYAHQRGLVHRDIKPTNIMVEKTERGWKPYILDFGLARPQAAPGITQKGVVVGTPHYMAPEQVRMAGIDARTDVYALGATLYHLIAGKPPFMGSSAEVMFKSLHDEPDSLRTFDPQIAPDLDTMILKCLEKEPAARYQTARSFAEDLQHYLDGEPVSARHANWTHRLWKKTRKNKVSAVILAAGFVLTIVLVSLLLFAQWKGKAQARYAREFGDEVRTIEAMLLNAYTAPLQDIRPKLNQARSRLQQIQIRVQEGGRWAYGPGHNALGQGYLMLKEYPAAKDHLEKAWAAGYREPSTAYALGKTLGSLWQQAWIDSDGYSSRPLRDQVRREANRKYAQPAIQYLQEARGHSESPAYVEGLIALYEERYETALEKAAEALKVSLQPYEVLKLQGDIHFSIGSKAAARGEYDIALASLQSAGECYRRAQEIARSDQDIYIAEAQRLIRIMLVESQKGQMLDLVESALAVCENAIRVNPENARPYLYKSEVYLQYGTDQIYHGSNDARVQLQKAIETAHEAAKRERVAAAYGYSGRAYLRIGEYETAYNRDPGESLNQAVAESQKALQIDPHYADAFFNIAGAEFYLGEYKLTQGENPTPWLEKVIEIYNKDLRSFTKDDFAYNLLGLAYLDLGEYKLQHGKDPRVELQKAIENYSAALAINPKASFVDLNLGLAYTDIAKYEMNHAIDPNASLDRALQRYEEALKIQEDFAFAVYDRGLAYLVRAEHKLRSDDDPEPDLDQAMQQFQKTLQLNPELTLPAVSMANVDLLRAKYKLRKRKTPTMELGRAGSALETYLAKNDATPDVYRLLGDVYLQQAQWRLQQRHPAADLVERGLRQIELAAKMNPEDPETIAVQTGLQSLRNAADHN